MDTLVCRSGLNTLLHWKEPESLWETVHLRNSWGRRCSRGTWNMWCQKVRMCLKTRGPCCKHAGAKLKDLPVAEPGAVWTNQISKESNTQYKSINTWGGRTVLPYRNSHWQMRKEWQNLKIAVWQMGAWNLNLWTTKDVPQLFLKNKTKRILFTWLCWDFVSSFSAHGLSSWGVWAQPVIEAHGPSCSTAAGILLPWPGIEPMSPALKAGFWTTGPPGMSSLSYS